MQRFDAREQSRQLHPHWEDNDNLLRILAQNAERYPNQVAMRERDHGIWQEYT